MTSPDLEEAITPEGIVAALADSEPSWLTLPVPDQRHAS